MAASPVSYPGKPNANASLIQPMHVLVLLSLSAGTVLWGWFLMTGQQPGVEEKFLFWLALFGLASGCFIFTRVHGNRLHFFDLPVFLTVYFFLRFGLAPLRFFIDPAHQLNGFGSDNALLVEALKYTVLGVGFFWVGCSIFKPKGKKAWVQRVPAASGASSGGWNTILAAGCALYVAGFATKLYELSHHFYSYAGSSQAVQNSLAAVQVLTCAAGFATYGLVILCIEKYRHPADVLRNRLFWIAFVTECGWGLVSGMKGDVIRNFVIVALVSSLVQRKFRKGWIVAAVAGLVLLYPVTNSYRSLLRKTGNGITSFSSAASLGSQALAKTTQSQPGFAGMVESGWNMSVGRLDLLWSFGKVLSLGSRTALLRGKERWWMIPYYPFIPRFIWHSKPKLYKGKRFSVALGIGDKTSTAVTYPGDLYVTYGLAGLIAGMFLLGVVAQWLTGKVNGLLEKRALFVYASIFLVAANMEIDSFSYWSSLIKDFVIISAVALVVYGPPRRDRKVLLRRKDPAAAES